MQLDLRRAMKVRLVSNYYFVDDFKFPEGARPENLSSIIFNQQDALVVHIYSPLNP